MYYLKPCPKCNVHLKFPLYRGKLDVRCPMCLYTFKIDPDDTKLYKDGSFELPKNRSVKDKWKKIFFRLLKGGKKKYNFNPSILKKLTNTFDRLFVNKIRMTINPFLKKIQRENPVYRQQKINYSKNSNIKSFNILQVFAIVFLFFMLPILISQLICYRRQTNEDFKIRNETPNGYMTLEEYRKYQEELKKQKQFYKDNQESNDGMNDNNAPEKKEKSIPEFPKDEPFLHEGIPQKNDIK